MDRSGSHACGDLGWYDVSLPRVGSLVRLTAHGGTAPSSIHVAVPRCGHIDFKLLLFCRVFHRVAYGLGLDRDRNVALN